jgi:hypothetical protein
VQRQDQTRQHQRAGLPWTGTESKANKHAHGGHAQPAPALPPPLPAPPSPRALRACVHGVPVCAAGCLHEEQRTAKSTANAANAANAQKGAHKKEHKQGTQKGTHTRMHKDKNETRCECQGHRARGRGERRRRRTRAQWHGACAHLASYHVVPIFASTTSSTRKGLLYGCAIVCLTICRASGADSSGPSQMIYPTNTKQRQRTNKAEERKK